MRDDRFLCGTDVSIQASYVDTHRASDAALVELGRAVKSTFIARYLGSEAPRREINDGAASIGWDSRPRRPVLRQGP